MADNSNPARLPTSHVWIYGLPALALTAVGVPLLLFLVPFYTSEKGLHPGTVGYILLGVRMLDGLFDPTFGMISDRTHSRWGRRRPWLVIGTLALVISVYQIFLPPAQVTWVYFLIWAVLLYASWTIVIVPYVAWGAEMTKDFNERTRIAGVREMFLLLGTVLAASVPTVAAQLGHPGQKTTMAAIGLFVIIGLPLSIALFIWRVPEHRVELDSHNHDWRAGIRVIRRNGPFLRLISAFLLNSIAQAVVATLFIYYAGYILGIANAPVMLLPYFLSGIATVPLWVKLADRFGKHRVWAVSMAFSALVFLLTPFIGADSAWMLWIVVILAGPSLGCDQILASSMQADVVDVDTLRSGQERAGVYFALWNMVTKLAGGLAAGIALPLLGFAGLVNHGPNPQAVNWTLIGLFCLLPPTLRLVSVWIIWNYPITRERHAKLRAMVDRKKLRLAALEQASNEQA